jgi:hypothetical protein
LHPFGARLGAAGPAGGAPPPPREIVYTSGERARSPARPPLTSSRRGGGGGSRRQIRPRAPPYRYIYIKWHSQYAPEWLKMSSDGGGGNNNNNNNSNSDSDSRRSRRDGAETRSLRAAYRARGSWRLSASRSGVPGGAQNQTLSIADGTRSAGRAPSSSIGYEFGRRGGWPPWRQTTANNKPSQAGGGQIAIGDASATPSMRIIIVVVRPAWQCPQDTPATWALPVGLAKWPLAHSSPEWRRHCSAPRLKRLASRSRGARRSLESSTFGICRQACCWRASE